MSAVSILQLTNAALDCEHIEDIATSTGLTATDRLGRSKLTMQGALASLGYQVPVAYASGINLTAGTQTVEYSGTIYAPLISDLPFTTSGTFESAKFRPIQVDRADFIKLSQGITLQDAIFWTTPKLHGGVGGGVANDTAAVQSALESGKLVFLDDVYKCDPMVVTGHEIRLITLPGAKLVFDAQSTDMLELISCTGSISGLTIDDAPKTGTGIYATLVARTCTDLTFHDLTINGGKDLPFIAVDCDNVHVIDGRGYGTTTDRPFAWELVGCSGSTLTRCKLKYYQFGQLIIGPGYKTGTTRFMTTRDQEDCLGSQIISGYVEDYTGHAFDINGTAGAKVKGCTAKDYTGSSGNSSFQIKQSTNVAEELPDLTYLNTVQDCIAINCATGFSAQEGMYAQFLNNTVKNAKRYPLSLNGSANSTVKGLKVYDYGTDLTTFPLQNGDTICGAVAVWSGSDGSYIDDVELFVESNHSNVTILTGVTVIADSCTLGRMNIRKTAAAQMYSAAVIDGDNTLIEPSLRVTGPTYYVNNAIQDFSTTTIYPLVLGGHLPVDASKTKVFDIQPQRGMVVCRVTASAATTITGSPTYSLGIPLNLEKFVASRAVPATTETVNALTYISTGEHVVLRVNASASTGDLHVSVRGVELL